MIKGIQSAIVVAMDTEGGFSKDGNIPWRISSDFKWFKELTKDSIVVVGRVTYEDLTKRQQEQGRDMNEPVLPGRECFVVSSTLEDITNATVIKSINELVLPGGPLSDSLMEQYEKLFFIGGKRIYDEGLSYVNDVFTTIINDDYECDVFFDVDKLSELFDPQILPNKRTDDEPEYQIVRWVRNFNKLPPVAINTHLNKNTQRRGR